MLVRAAAKADCQRIVQGRLRVRKAVAPTGIPRCLYKITSAL
jgi:hypothetical protein